MLDIYDIAAKLDNDEQLEVTYQVATRTKDGEIVRDTRTGKLLDVAEESGLLYVSYQGKVIWVKADEVLEINPM